MIGKKWWSFSHNHCWKIWQWLYYWYWFVLPFFFEVFYSLEAAWSWPWPRQAASQPFAAKAPGGFRDLRQLKKEPPSTLNGKKSSTKHKRFFLEVLPCFTCNSLKDRQVPVPAEVHRDAYRVSSFSHFASSQIQFLCVHSYFTLVYACMRVVHTYRHTCMHACIQ